MLKLSRRMIGAALLGLCGSLGTTQSTLAQGGAATGMQRVTQQLVKPPFLPKHEQVAKGAPKIVHIRMVIEEKLMQVDADDTKVWAMTFNGSVPGPIVVVHQNDDVELTLVNPASNSLMHNIDFHAATGAMGGGELTHVLPGRAGGAALQGDQGGGLCLPLRARRRHDSLACGVGHERRDHGVAA